MVAGSADNATVNGSVSGLVDGADRFGMPPAKLTSEDPGSTVDGAGSAHASRMEPPTTLDSSHVPALAAAVLPAATRRPGVRSITEHWTATAGQCCASDLPFDPRSSNASWSRAINPSSARRRYLRGSYSFLYGVPSSGSSWYWNARGFWVTNAPIG